MKKKYIKKQQSILMTAEQVAYVEQLALIKSTSVAYIIREIINKSMEQED